MPPKAKLSKAEKEKLKQEEAERKAREEEEQRLREEEERLAREEKERKEREEREKLKAEEEARFLEETNNLNKILEGQKDELDRWKEGQQHKTQWQHYISCSALPDPSDEKATNTYLSICEEEGKPGEIKETLDSISQLLDLYHEVERWLYGDGLPTPTDKKVHHYKQVMSRIRTLVAAKLDRDTLHFLQRPEDHVDSETHNLRVEDSLNKHQLTYCLWGNVIKNPRMKDFSFKDHLQFTLELPKPLLLADSAVRVLRLPFDDLSPQCHSYHCKRSPPSTGISTQSGGSEPTDGEAPGDQEEAVSHESEERSREGGDERKESVTSKPEVPSEAGVEVPAGGRGGDGGEVTSIMAIEEEVATVSEKTEDQQVQEDSEAGQSEALPTSEGGPESDEVNLRGFRAAGWPFIIELLEMPPPAKSVNNWTIRKVVSTELTICPYPSVVKSQPREGENEATERPIPIPGSAMWPPIGITMQLPQSYLFKEKPQLARWDGEAKVWRTGGFQEVLFDLDDKTVTFQTFHFAPLAIMVDRYVNMPYQSWEMLPLGPNHTQLTIGGGMVQVTIDVKEHTSTLLAPSPEEVPVLAHLIHKELTARELMQALTVAGANFFPEPDADDYVSITSKRPVVELSVYQSMSLASSGFAFQWSRWNSEVSRSKVVLRVAQPSPTSATPVTSSDNLSWTTYLAGRKSYKLKVTEDSEEFCMDMQDGCETHPGLFAALEHDASNKTKERMRNTSPMHIEAIKLWLDSVKMVTFS